MDSRSNYEKERERYAAETEALLNSRIKAMQQRLYSAVSEVVASLAIDEAGKLVFSVRNITAAGQVDVVMKAFQEKENLPLLRWLFRRLINLLGINRLYFKASGHPVEKAEDKVRELMLRRYGYDAKSGRIVRGGYLSSLASSDAVGLRILRRINDAIAARQSLSVFRKIFRADFVNQSGLGMLERHYRTFTNDLFAEFDRGVQAEYSEELGLGFAIYAPNSVMSETRLFCERRVGNIYEAAEIEQWNSQEWKGKIPGKPVQLQCGGYNCRHHLHYIDQADATRLLSRRGRELNQYNSI